MAGIYLHIPFCVKKCRYCDFVSFPDDGRMASYVDALIAEIRLRADKLPVPPSIESVFFGGGTPSLLSGEQLAAILRALRECYPVSPGAECSVECNPGTVTPDKLEAYRRAGVNRLSIGAQSTDPALLLLIGRIHTRLQFLDAVRFAHKAGFSNINVDVMHGLPTQSAEQYLSTLCDVCDLDVTHISAYSLILEENTPLYHAVKSGELEMPDPDLVADMQDAGIEYLAGTRFHRYEISNFAMDGFQCRHNLNYWDNGEYLGFGLAAHGALRVAGRRGAGQWTRFENTVSLPEYFSRIAAGRLPNAQTIRLYPGDEMFETVMLGLRKVRGIDRAAFATRFGLPVEEAYPEACRKLEQNGWLAVSPTHFALNAKGLDLQNAALQFFM